MRYHSLIAIVVLSLFISGCIAMKPASDTDRGYTAPMGYDEGTAAAQQVSSNVKFEDIPLPSGAYIVVKDSFAFSNDFTRVGVVEYVVAGDITSITSFFKKQMPLFNWSTIHSIEYYKSVMMFEKSGRMCTIIVEQRGHSKVVFTVAYGPRK